MRSAWPESGLPPARMVHIKKANIPSVDIVVSVFLRSEEKWEAKV